ncbi:MAG: SDR family NAD(P)-dependent oxidoreductase [Rhodospirillales bacterium]|nr:SDR family NAD(P)-dependent oxidoreductase [Alphaproteobacteria bacterium]MCB9986708.1 SDR family NAD(P)-dependent oxidoreductase [Rhodospirillales bacterium]USO08522.1 MAG: SDR family NAD(P)-dependent oxidoreductase [Rhodospirillales bacterium]
MNIVITGASSGIGEALALHYAAKGVSLGLTGRDGARLEGVARACRRKGALVEAAVLDVCDRAGMRAWLEKFDSVRPVDLAIVNAGIGGGARGATPEALEAARRIFEVNIDGVNNTLEPLLPRMAARKAGQVALMASLAGYRGVPGAPAYAASKGFVKLYGEGLRGALWRKGIRVNVICPGFVVSRLTGFNDFPMPFLMSAERAAAIIARGLARNRPRIAFPWPMAFAVWWLAALPAVLSEWVVRRLPKKK